MNSHSLFCVSDFHVIPRNSYMATHSLHFCHPKDASALSWAASFTQFLKSRLQNEWHPTMHLRVLHQLPCDLQLQQFNLQFQILWMRPNGIIKLLRVPVTVRSLRTVFILLKKNSGTYIHPSAEKYPLYR